MKILVTGANGYIGSKVVKVLCDQGENVIAADLDNAHIDTRASFIKANVFENNDDWFTILGSPDVCLHMAWRDGFIHDSPKHMSDISNHFNFMKSLVDHGLKKFASMGTMHEIGFFEGAVDENTPCNPLSQYGVAKNALRKSVELYCASKGCQFQWLRAFYIYGDDLFGNSVFVKIRKAVLEGQKSFPLNSGKNKYDFINVDTLAKQISASIEQDNINGIINVCSGKPVSLGEQIEWYISHYHLNIELEYGKFPDRPYDSPCIYGNNEKINLIMEESNK